MLINQTHGFPRESLIINRGTYFALVRAAQQTRYSCNVLV